MHKCPKKSPCKHEVWLSLEVKGTSHGFAVSQKGAPASGIVTSDLKFGERLGLVSCTSDISRRASGAAVAASPGQEDNKDNKR